MILHEFVFRYQCAIFQDSVVFYKFLGRVYNKICDIRIVEIWIVVVCFCCVFWVCEAITFKLKFLCCCITSLKRVSRSCLDINKDIFFIKDLLAPYDACPTIMPLHTNIAVKKVVFNQNSCATHLDQVNIGLNSANRTCYMNCVTCKVSHIFCKVIVLHDDIWLFRCIVTCLVESLEVGR